MNLRSNYFDWALVIPIIFLLILGLAIIWSLVPQLLVYQIVFALISIVVFVIVSRTDYKIFEAVHLPVYIVSVLSLTLPFIFGAASRGAHRWLQFGNNSIQPSELIKPFLLITYSMIAVNTTKNKHLFLVSAFALPALIVFLQPDLGTSLVLGIAWITILMTQIKMRWFLIGALILVLLSPLSWIFLKSYQKDRLMTFVNPYNDPLGTGYHVIQSVIAVGSGQVFGRGLGQGTQSNLRFLPERHTDFIFASLTEDFGFLGGALVIVLFIIILWRIYHISHSTSDPVASYYCIAVLAMVGFQSFVNIGMNMGLVPVTGITLPFLSYGGSSLLSLAIVFGIVHSISISSHENKF